ncbi:MAG: fructose-bisphosphate aldolase class I, partial [Cytophagaceae bacterium]
TKPMAGFPGEKITEGLDGLRERLAEYKTLGARFAKWRAVITIDKDIPTDACIAANMQQLALYAALCQEADLVPMVEPEVLMTGDHTMERCYDVTEKSLKLLFDELYLFHVDLEAIILKPNMVIAGEAAALQNTVDEVAAATVNCLRASVPVAVPAIAWMLRSRPM